MNATSLRLLDDDGRVLCQWDNPVPACIAGGAFHFTLWGLALADGEATVQQFLVWNYPVATARLRSPQHVWQGFGVTLNNAVITIRDSRPSPLVAAE